MILRHAVCDVEPIRKFKLEENTIDFIGHSLALFRDDAYLGQPALEMVKRVKVDIVQIFRILKFSVSLHFTNLWFLLVAAI